MWSGPTTATSVESRLAVPPPPHAETESTSASSAEARMTRRRGFMAKKSAPVAAAASRCLTRVEYSIDQPDRSGESVVAKRHFALGRRVHGGVEPAAQLPQ